MNIRTTIFAVVAALCAMGVAHAQPIPPVGTVRPLVGVGITSGGDTLATVQYTNGWTTNVRAGGLLQVYVGGDWRVSQYFSVQGNIGWHFNRAGATNGSVEFTRYPIELLAYYHATPGFRIGGGARFVQSPSLSGSGVGSNVSGSFSSTTGTVIEGEWFLGRMNNYSLKLRFVDEKYKADLGGGYTQSFNGSHVGFMGNFYF